MKAMILAAGLGTRLKPLTKTIPKALVPLAGKPLIFHIINKLIAAGVTEIIINVHHFAGSIIEYIESNDQFGAKIAFSREETLLDTGGGLKNASWFFNDENPFILHNVDVVSELDISEMINYHKENHALATLAVRERKTSRYFLFDHNNQLVGWQSLETGEKEIARKTSEPPQSLSFMGIHILSPALFSLLPQKRIFSIVKAYLELARQGYAIYGFRNENEFWLDLGKTENLKQAEQYLKRKMK
jgi:NDP-sugar pyrophosphorylase family protein